MNGKKTILSALLIVLTFVFVTGCGQSAEQKTLQAEINASIKQIDEQLLSLKQTEKGLSADQAAFEAIQKRVGKSDSLLNAQVQEHAGLVKEYKKGTEELTTVFNTLSPLPEKLKESWKFSMSLMKEDYEKAKEKVDQVAANAEVLVEKHDAIKEKLSKYQQAQSEAAPAAQQ
jgi:DNA repair exonuclease SbcCD ATPase subunit